MKTAFKIIKEWLIPVFGIILAAYGILLTQQGNSELAKAQDLQKVAETTAFQVTLEKIVMFDNPAYTKQEFETFSSAKVQTILKTTYEDLNSQMQNQYLVANRPCYKVWTEFSKHLILEINDPTVFPLMGTQHSIESDYYAQIDSLANECWSL
jgi:hypothetical protein